MSILPTGGSIPTAPAATGDPLRNVEAPTATTPSPPVTTEQLNAAIQSVSQRLDSRLAAAAVDLTAAIAAVYAQLATAGVLKAVKIAHQDSGRNGAGAVSTAESGVALVGDKVIAVLALFIPATPADGLKIACANLTGSFEATVTVVDQVQQTGAGDTTTRSLLFILGTVFTAP